MIEKFLNPREILINLGLKEKDIFADLGCGSGFFVIEAGKIVGKEGIVYAVDIQKNVLLNLKNKILSLGLNNIKLVWADLEILGSTRIPESTVNIVLLANVLFQVSKKKEVLKESIRILKPGGKICIIDWKTESTLFGPPSEERVSKEEIKKICDNLGLENKIFEGDASKFHWQLVYKK